MRAQKHDRGISKAEEKSREKEFWRLPLSLRLGIFDTQIPTPMSTTQGCPKTPGILTSGLSGSSNTIPRDPIGVFDQFTTPTHGKEGFTHRHGVVNVPDMGKYCRSLWFVLIISNVCRVVPFLGPIEQANAPPQSCSLSTYAPTSGATVYYRANPSNSVTLLADQGKRIVFRFEAL